MSRVDEALKRASGATVAEHAVEERQPRRGDEGLDYYPREGSSGGSRHETTEPPHRRVVAAPRTGTRDLGPLDVALVGKLIVDSRTSSVAVEQYRRLAAAVHELQLDRGLKTLMVTSALPEEGKTLTVANLALTLSESYKRRVLLIDADLRRPSIHTVFRLPNASGLSDGLRANPTELTFLEVSPFLSVLPAGQADHNPMSKLTSERIRVLLEESEAKFDWVLLDAPPVGLMADANLLARLTHGVLFVIKAGATSYAAIDRAITELGRDRIIGTVLNRVADEQMSTDYQKYYAATPAK